MLARRTVSSPFLLGLEAVTGLREIVDFDEADASAIVHPRE